MTQKSPYVELTIVINKLIQGGQDMVKTRSKSKVSTISISSLQINNKLRIGFKPPEDYGVSRIFPLFYQ